MRVEAGALRILLSRLKTLMEAIGLLRVERLVWIVPFVWIECLVWIPFFARVERRIGALIPAKGLIGILKSSGIVRWVLYLECGIGRCGHGIVVVAGCLACWHEALGAAVFGRVPR
jgi:hypothetical protein